MRRPGRLPPLGTLSAGAPVLPTLAAVTAMGRFRLDQARQQNPERRIAILSEA